MLGLHNSLSACRHQFYRFPQIYNKVKNYSSITWIYVIRSYRGVAREYPQQKVWKVTFSIIQCNIFWSSLIVLTQPFLLWSNSANHLTAVLSTPKYNLSNKYRLHRLMRSIYQTIIHCQCGFLLAMIITKHLIDFVMNPVSQQQCNRHAGPPCRCCSTSRGR